MQNLLRSIAAFAWIVLLAGSARAEDVYYSVPLKDLKTVDGKIIWPDFPDTADWRDRQRIARREPSVHPDQAGAEAYLVFAERTVPGSGPWFYGNGPGSVSVVLCGPVGVDLTGQVLFPADKGTGMTPVKFIVPAAPVES